MGIKKIILAFIVVVFFLFATTVILLKTIIPSNRLKNYIQWQICSFTGGQAEIKNVSVGFSGVVLSGIKVIFIDNSEIIIEKLIVAPNLFPFPRKQIALNEVRIINPEIKLRNNFENNIKLKRTFHAHHVLVMSSLIIKNGAVYLPGVKINKLDLNVRNVSLKASFPVEAYFSVNDADVNIKSECNIDKAQITIEEAVIKNNGKSVLLSGEIKDFMNFKSINFTGNVNGNGVLFNKIFLSNLYKKKITIFEKENINLTIKGNLENFQVSKN
ncbi:MAG: hypothetical protein PHE88_08140 [Elusimicrobia bacterium]|nr:hypothetical protein [Elusimicrobiota bacterium]